MELSVGTSVAVYGTVGPTGLAGPSKSTYTLDGASPITYTAPVSNRVINGVTYYRSPILKDGEHSLVITDMQDSTYFWIDYISYA